MSIPFSAWFESPPKSVERLPWTSMNFRSNLRWITVGQHLNSFYRYLLCNDLLLIFFFPKRVILCSDLPFTSVGVLYINLAGSKLSPYFFLLFIRQRFNSFLCPKSQVLSYSSVQYLSRFIPRTNPHLPLFPLLSWVSRHHSHLWQDCTFAGPGALKTSTAWSKETGNYTVINLSCHHFPFGNHNLRQA